MYITMLDEIDLEELGIDYDPDEEPWKQEKVLDELLNTHGYNYAQLGAAFDVDPDSIGNQARKYGVNPGKGPAYTKNTVPVGKSEGQWAKGGTEHYAEYEIPLPQHVLEKLGLTQPQYDEDLDGMQQRGSLVRYMFDVVDKEIVLHIDTTPALEERGRVFANERRIGKRPSNYHSIARVPREIVRMVGLNEPGDRDTVWGGNTRKDYQMGRDATINVQGSSVATISFAPALEPEIFLDINESPPQSEDGAIPSAENLNLTALPYGADSTPEETEKYELDLPQSYVEAYELERSVEGEKTGTPVKFSFGLFVETIDENGESKQLTKPALIAEFGQDVEKDEKGAVRTVQARTDDLGYEQWRLYPPKAGLHALGLGVLNTGEKYQPSVRIEPGENGFALFPADDQEVYDAVENLEDIKLPSGDKAVEAPASQ